MATLERNKINKFRSFTVHLDENGKVIDIDPPEGQTASEWVPLEIKKPKILSMDTLEIYQVEGSTLTCVHSACKLR
jgi:hypothetical protein